jgi:3-oxoacyl-[acyl-carrier-protein] synthase II
MEQRSEVVITGVGVVSPIGIGKRAYWDSMLAGRSGVGPLDRLAGTDYPVKFGAEIKNFDGKQFVKPRKSLKVMCREIQIGYSAAVLAVEDAGLQPGTVEPDRYGAVLGSEVFFSEVEEMAAAYSKCVVDGQLRPDLWGASAMSDLYPLWMLKYLPNMVGCHLAITLDARGPNNTITMDGASCLLALIEGATIIERGWADVMLVGGTGSRLNLTRLLYRGDGEWSHRHGAPAEACRPFDADRDGTVPGEGAGVFVLESRRHAEARGANILARVLGFGRSFQPSGDGGPSGVGARGAIRGALQAAGLEPRAIGHVNAHAAGMVDADRVEAQALRDCLGDVPVTAPKSYFGTLGAGTGAVEMAASVLAINERQVPMTLNYQRPDPECPVNVVRDQPLRIDNTVGMVFSLADTGQNAAVIIAAP